MGKEYDSKSVSVNFRSLIQIEHSVEAVVSDDDATHLSPSSILKSIKSNETGTEQAQVANASRSTNCFRNIGSFLYRYAMRRFPRGDRKTKDGKDTDAPISTWCSTSKETHSRGNP